jgi:hypothetical protein
MTPDQLKKYLQSIEDFRQEVAMTLALHFCRKEIEIEEGLAPAEAETKPRKRPEKEVTVAANRLRLLFTCGAYGTVTTTSREVNSARAFAKAWSFRALEPRPVEEPEPIPVILPSDLEEPESEAALRRARKGGKKASAKKKVAKKAPAKKAGTKKVAKKAPAKKKVAKKAPAKKAASKKAATKKSAAKSSSRSGGGTRPRTTRTTRKRSVSKKSSRRS